MAANLLHKNHRLEHLMHAVFHVVSDPHLGDLLLHLVHAVGH